MCNAWNHPASCTCGWGGDGHLGVAHGGIWHGGLLDFQEHHLGLLSQVAQRHRTSFSVPVRCWYCDQQIYIYVNEYGSIVLFDELGWPWPKHECKNAPVDLSGDSVRRPRRFLTSMPPDLSRWFTTILGVLEKEGKNSSYATVSRVPLAVLNGEYDRPRPTLEFLRDLSQANKLRRGIFLPLDCTSCELAVWVFVPASGEPSLVSPNKDGFMRSHHCFKGSSSKISAIRHSLPPTLSWRKVESVLRASAASSIPVQVNQTIIGFVTGQEGEDLLVKLWNQTSGVRRVRLAKGVQHPIYTLVVAVPDPYHPGAFVVRAPTFEQFVRGLPGSLEKIVRASELISSARGTPSSGTQPVVQTPPSLKAAGKVKKVKAMHVNRELLDAKYPKEFSRPEVLKFFHAVTVDTLTLKAQKQWRQLEETQGWHLGGAVPADLTFNFVAALNQAEQSPDQRPLLLDQLSRIGHNIAFRTSKALRKQK